MMNKAKRWKKYRYISSGYFIKINVNIHEKNGFAESKNLAEYRSESNFVEPSK